MASPESRGDEVFDPNSGIIKGDVDAPITRSIPTSQLPDFIVQFKKEENRSIRFVVLLVTFRRFHLVGETRLKLQWLLQR